MAIPRMRVIAGPNGSGKSTVAEELIANHPTWIGIYVNAAQTASTFRVS
jgi:predicted ABC-type ATPase